MFKFKNKKHQFDFFTLLAKENCIDDSERYSLFYLLTFNEDTFNHINDLYNFETKSIKFSGLNCDWQTSSSKAITKLAFHLFNFNNEFNLVKGLSSLTSLDYIYITEAFKIRFNFEV